ncbi:MAG TPA: hypothetical protein VFB72_12570 [Verrucomicrobiae bacterium]|nr:hypothetical protein [Verrucomicrobiae bacterium]
MTNGSEATVSILNPRLIWKFLGSSVGGETSCFGRFVREEGCGNNVSAPIKRPATNKHINNKPGFILHQDD